MIRAGADVVLGNHSHVVGPVEFIDGAPVLYSMGDLVFDLPRFEATEEGVLVELTFHGAELAQVELHPTVIVDRAQLNLLERAVTARSSSGACARPRRSWSSSVHVPAETG